MVREVDVRPRNVVVLGPGTIPKTPSGKLITSELPPLSRTRPSAARTGPPVPALSVTARVPSSSSVPPMRTVSKAGSLMVLAGKLDELEQLAVAAAVALFGRSAGILARGDADVFSGR